MAEDEDHLSSDEEPEDLQAEGPNPVDLGFLEEANPKLLLAPRFPSKAGGKPAWLNPLHLPTVEQLSCRGCHEVMTFLLQVYTGGSWEADDCFHRTIFLFCCSTAACTERNRFKAFRNQLPRINEYYSSKPPSDDLQEDLEVKISAVLCSVCGAPGPSRCGKCHAVAYCSKKHQLWDWKHGHKAACKSQESDAASQEAEPSSTSSTATATTAATTATTAATTTTATATAADDPSLCELLLPEMELIIDAEPPANPYSEAEEIEKFARLAVTVDQELANQVTHNDIKSVEDQQPGDEDMLNFQRRVSREPAQVLRYQQLGSALWIGPNKPNDNDIPLCSQCDAPRRYEFQVMPQLLSLLEVGKSDVFSSLDFGVLAVYTCVDSCSIGEQYVEEFIWRNDVV